MAYTKPTAWQRYQEAHRMLTEAVGLLDEVQHELKMAKIDCQADGYRRPTPFQLHVDAESMLENLTQAECDDCGKKLAECECAWLGRPKTGTNEDAAVSVAKNL